MYEVSSYRIAKAGELKSPNEYKFVRLELLQKMENLQNELADMVGYLNDDLKQETNDAKANELMDKLNELEKQIVEIIK